MLNKIRITLQYLLPKNWLTQIAGTLAEWQGGYITQCIIKLFIYFYNINMKEIQEPDIKKYVTFNEFFIRKLKKSARPIDNTEDTLVAPVDGTISQIGKINKNYIFQAKGHFYSLEALLAGNEKMINYFKDGNFSTIYLSPKDYHRVHMPCNGTLHEVLYVPGELFSVHPLMTKNIDNLFARNERLICLFDTNFGPIIQILVGAAIMGSITTMWAGTITPPREGIIKHWHYPKNNQKSINLHKGQEMGLFKLGSTVINLFSKDKILFDDNIYNNYIIKIGMRLAQKIQE